MSSSIIGAMSKWGIAFETTVGTGVDPTGGVTNFNKANILPGQAWIEDAKATGFTVQKTDEVYDGNIDPTWSPETVLVFDSGGALFGKLVYMLTQKGVESGTAPYIQTMQPDTTNGKTVDFGGTVGAGQLTCSAKQFAGQTTPREVRAAGGIVNRIDLVFAEGQLVKITPSFLFMAYKDNVATGGTYTLAAQTFEKMTRDFKWKIGDGTPVALYSPEMNLSLIADVAVKRYGGVNTVNAGGPCRFVYNGWSCEGSFSKPVVAATDSLSKSHLFELGTDQLMHIYTMADYNTAQADRDVLITLNIKLDTVERNHDNELIESVTFHGVHDGTNNIFVVATAQTATQVAWCAG